ncbi:MAG: hypothetical protein ACYTEL_16785 [Planctomycetota bacterium]|jgi:hypothetical protein
MKRIILCLVTVVAWAIPCRAEFQLNTYTDGDQQYPAIAMGPNGNFVVVWRSEGLDGAPPEIYGRRFSASGTPVGDEFQINTTPAVGSTFGDLSVAVDGAGNFVVTWHCGDGSSEGIAARRYDAQGVPVAGEFLVNTWTDGRQQHPSVAMHDSGEFVITWQSEHNPDHHRYTTGRKYHSNGTPYGPEFLITQLRSGFYPDVVIDDSGDFVVAWQRAGDSDSPPQGNFIRFRRYNADTTPKGNAVQITGHVPGRSQPSIGMDGGGNFVITWVERPDTYDIYARCFDANGNAIAGQFIVNTYLAGTQGRSSVAVADDGRFVIVWHGPGDGSDDGIFGQRYLGDGTRIGDEFRVNTYVLGRQRFPDVAIRGDGEFVTVWHSYGQDGDGYGIFGDFGLKIPCADVTGDLFVNLGDYCVLAQEWLEEGDSLETDLIVDSKVDELDLAAFCWQWLSSCP